jgi:hypothetical protein
MIYRLISHRIELDLPKSSNITNIVDWKPLITELVYSKINQGFLGHKGRRNY